MNKKETVDAKNMSGWTPLHYAASNGHTVTAELLIFKGADTDARDEFGCSPLHHAALHGHTKTAELLISKGETPLHEAAPDSLVIKNLFMKIENASLILMIRNYRALIRKMDKDI